jgi:multiple sugar transport system permease protein
VKPEKVGIAIGFILICIWVLFPIFWAVNISLQAEPDIKTAPPFYLPPNPTLKNYDFVINAAKAIQERLETFGLKGEFLPAITTQYPRAIINSIVVGLVAMGYNMIAALLASYVFTRIKFKGSGPLFYLSIMGRLIPPVAIAVPYYIIMFNAGLLDSLFAVVLIHIYFTLPINIWILNTYFASLPEEVEDAARVDGYSRLETLFKFVLPMIRPALIAIGIIAFMFSWGEFFFTLLITATESSRTLPVVVGFMSAQPLKPMGIITAAGVLAMIPPLVLVAIFRRYLIRGLVAGAVKA